MKRICLKDVAQAAGVSAVTASIVLNGASGRSRARVSKEREAEIRRIARELGYQASAAARILKTRGLNDIGLLIFEEAEIIREHAGFTDLNIQFTRECRRLGLRHQVEWFDPIHNPNTVPELLTGGLVGGLLIAGNPQGASEQFLRESCSLPVVRIEEPGDYSVMFDARPAIREAMKYLARTGHRRIAMVNGPEFFRVFREILDTFRQSCAEFGLTALDECYSSIDPYADLAANAALAEQRLFGRPGRPDAALIYGGPLVKGILYLAERRGVHVPEDASVVAFAIADWEAAKSVPPLSAVEYDYREITAAAVDMLRRLMHSGGAAETQLRIPQRFTLRKTVTGRS